MKKTFSVFSVLLMMIASVGHSKNTNIEVNYECSTVNGESFELYYNQARKMITPHSLHSMSNCYESKNNQRLLKCWGASMSYDDDHFLLGQMLLKSGDLGENFISIRTDLLEDNMDAVYICEIIN